MFAKLGEDYLEYLLLFPLFHKHSSSPTTRQTQGGQREVHRTQASQIVTLVLAEILSNMNITLLLHLKILAQHTAYT